MTFHAVIADDDCIICEGLNAVLESSCKDLSIDGVFYNGADLLKHIKKHHTDIVISDIQMSEQTGLDVAKYVKDHFPHTRVILITGHKLFEYAKSAIDNNVCHFIIKPYDPAELIEIVNKIINELKEEINQSQIQTSVYFNNWHYLKRSMTEIYNTLTLPKELSSLLFCTYTKSIDSLFIKIISVQTSNIDISEQIGDFDSINLSSLVVSKLKNEFVIMIFYIDEYAVQSFFNDMEKHAKILNSQIKITAEESWGSIYEMVKEKSEKTEVPDITELAKSYIEKNFSDPELSIETIALKLHISKNYLGTLLKKKTGVSYNEYLMKCRMEKAAQLLENSHLSVKEIALRVGYRSPDYFRKNFKEHFGDTPINWQRNTIKK